MDAAASPSVHDPAFAVRALHLDLKGLPPSFDRLLRLLEVIAGSGYNALLVEWEDAFPWTVDERFRSETAYSAEEIQRFHEKAAEQGLEVIPLVQCLGHMETPLSLPEYEHLRELPHDAAIMNPLAEGARELVEQMVDDVLAHMPTPRHFHLGGDEAWTFGSHPDTKVFIEKHGEGALYLHHVEPILDKLHARGIRPLLWHDMMRDWDAEALRRLAKKADLVVWGYNGHPDTVEQHYSTKVIQRFADADVPMWGAGGYKGGDRADGDVPVLANRVENAEAWVEVGRRFGFHGLIATAWSRYATHVTQVEPIEGALDALVLLGMIFQRGQLPGPDRDAALQRLDELSERQQFETAREALLKLTETRDRAARHIYHLRRITVTATQDPRRRCGGSYRTMLDRLRQAMIDAEVAGDAVRAALTGALEPIWIDRYLDERLIPLREDLAMLEVRFRTLDPENMSDDLVVAGA